MGVFDAVRDRFRGGPQVERVDVENPLLRPDAVKIPLAKEEGAAAEAPSPAVAADFEEAAGGSSVREPTKKDEKEAFDADETGEGYEMAGGLRLEGASVVQRNPLDLGPEAQKEAAERASGRGANPMKMPRERRAVVMEKAKRAAESAVKKSAQDVGMAAVAAARRKDEEPAEKSGVEAVMEDIEQANPLHELTDRVGKEVASAVSSGVVEAVGYGAGGALAAYSLTSKVLDYKKFQQEYSSTVEHLSQVNDILARDPEHKYAQILRQVIEYKLGQMQKEGKRRKIDLTGTALQTVGGVMTVTGAGGAGGAVVGAAGTAAKSSLSAYQAGRWAYKSFRGTKGEERAQNARALYMLATDGVTTNPENLGVRRIAREILTSVIGEFDEHSSSQAERQARAETAFEQMMKNLKSTVR